MSNQTAKPQTAARAEAPSQAEQHLGRRAETTSAKEQHPGRRAEAPSQAAQKRPAQTKKTSAQEQHLGRRAEVPSQAYPKPPDVKSLTQEIADLHTRINQLLPNNEINQQGARHCIAVVAGRDANLSIDKYKVHIDNYLDQSKINITNVTSWDGMSDAIKSIGAEISAAVQANFLSSKTASQVQNMLSGAQENAESHKSAEVQRFLAGAKRQLEKVATEAVKNARTELDDTKNTGDVQERAKRSRGWLGIFAAIFKIILAIEYVSKLAPLLVWLI